MPNAAKAPSSTTGASASPRAQRLADAVVACGLPHYGRGDLVLGRHEIAAAQNYFAGLRRFGAATLDLAWVAAGRFDGFWERDLSPWDMAAGILLVREAGGFVSDLDGGEAILTKGNIAAGNDTMHRELLRLMKEAGKQAANDPERKRTKARPKWSRRHRPGAACPDNDPRAIHHAPQILPRRSR